MQVPREPGYGLQPLRHHNRWELPDRWGLAGSKPSKPQRSHKPPRFVPAVDSSWPAVDSSWPAVDSSWPAVDSSWPAVGSTWPAVDPT